MSIPLAQPRAPQLPIRRGAPWLQGVVLFGGLALYAICLARPIDLTSADLGRHLKNGELWLQQRNTAVFATNYYSYTDPDHPLVTHHWGAGVIFFLVWKLAGFRGLHLFFLAVSLATLWIVLHRTLQRSGAGLTALLVVLVMPLLAVRAEIRPEVFSYLFCVLFLHVLWRFRDDSRRSRWLWWLPAIEVLWVNLHISFVFGPALIGAFLLESLCTKPLRPTATLLAQVLVATCAAVLVSPFGVAGLIWPLTIFQHYGYRVLENQSVWFLERLITHPAFPVFKVAFGVLMTGLVWARLRGRQPWLTAEALMAVGVSGLAWRFFRNFSLFGFLALPIMAESLAAALGLAGRRSAAALHAVGASALVVALICVVTRVAAPLVPGLAQPRAMGLEPGNEAGGVFLQREQIQGPIFNNYDVGGYLIFYLFPRERVFVDNRPESYSVDFLQNVYVRMQEDEAVWREADDRYRFNAIIFNRLDATPWAQRFLVQRVDDPAWAPVFADGHLIVFLRRDGPNRDVIHRYEIPRSVFQVTPTSGRPQSH